MLKFWKKATLVGALLLGVCDGAASAAVLNLNLTADNAFSVYLATSDSQLGTLIGSGNNWPSTYNFTTTLNAGTNYFIHVIGTNWTSANGFPFGPPGDPSN